MHKVMVLNQKDVESLLDMGEILQAVEFAFKNEAEGKANMPPKIYLDLFSEFGGDFRAMPAYIEGACGVKWVSAYPDNASQGLISVPGVIIYSDPENGYPLAIMDGTSITDLRTGAAGGIAVKYLARKNSAIVGMVGAGRQAKAQLLAIMKTVPMIEEVKVTGCDGTEVRLAEEMKKKTGLSIRPVATIEEAVKADIVVTTTPVRQPIVKNEWIQPGTHINAIGADAAGKEELAPELLNRARIITDNIEQASHSGEINVPLSQGLIKMENISATLGEVVAGLKKGRESDEEITIFDSTGLAIQDMVTARIVFEKAQKSGQFLSIEWFA